MNTTPAATRPMTAGQRARRILELLGERSRTKREIAEAVGLSTSTVSTDLLRLRQRRFVREGWKDGRTRCYSLTDAGERYLRAAEGER